MKETGDIVLADFGISEILNDDGNSTITGRPLDEHYGTHGYMAPEIILKREYSFEVDVWSAGVVMYQCLEKHQPFFQYDESDLEEIFLDWKNVKDDVLNLEDKPKILSEIFEIKTRPSSAKIFSSLLLVS